jgi:glutathione S-transferase
MRARMALLLAGVAFDAFEIVLRDKPPALLAMSPKGTVPVLLLPDGEVLEESWDIMRWALAAADHQGWWRAAQTDENLQLLALNNGSFKQLLDRYKYPERFPEADRESSRQKALATFLIPLESRLAENTMLGGEQACATDIAIFPFVRQFAAVDPLWFAALPLPAVQGWLAKWVASSLFAACMFKTRRPSPFQFPALAP